MPSQDLGNTEGVLKGCAENRTRELKEAEDPEAENHNIIQNKS